VLLVGSGLSALQAMTVEQEQQFRYYYYEAIRLYQQNDMVNAYHLFQFCYDLNPKDAMVNLYLGMLHNQNKQMDRAIEYYQRAYQYNPQECWYQYTSALLSSGKQKPFEQGIAVLEEVTRLMPKEASAWEQLVQAYAAIGKYNQALTAQDELDKIEGYNYYSAMMRFRIHIVQQRAKDALKDLQYILEVDPTNMHCQMIRIQLLKQTKARTSELYDAYEQILRFNPGNALALNDYAYELCTHHGDLLRAEQMSQVAIRQEPDNAMYLDTYAWILYRKGEMALAQFYIQRVKELYHTQGIQMPRVIQQHYKQIMKSKK